MFIESGSAGICMLFVIQLLLLFSGIAAKIRTLLR
jgi:hypothetical protein